MTTSAAQDMPMAAAESVADFNSSSEQTTEAAAIVRRELETRAPAAELVPPPPGYIGIRPKRPCNITCAEWLLISRLPDGTEAAVIEPDSPAKHLLPYAALIVSVAGKPLSQFLLNPPPSGTVERVKYYREGLSTLGEVEVTLAEWPSKPKPPRKQRKSRARILNAACGRPPTRNERPVYVTDLGGQHDLSTTAKFIGERIVHRWAREDGFEITRAGRKLKMNCTTRRLSYAQLARDCGVAPSTLWRSIKELAAAGWCEVTSGAASRRPNHYTMTWPLGWAPQRNAKVVRMDRAPVHVPPDDEKA